MGECCWLGICCPPLEQMTALIALFKAHGNMDDAAAKHAAEKAMDALEDVALKPLLAALKHQHDKKDK